MTARTLLEFDDNGQPMRFLVTEAEPVTSPFTGRELMKLKSELSVAPQVAQVVKSFLANEPLVADDGSTWSAHIDMESYSNGGPHNLTITWSESEQLRADVVEFEGLALCPTRYEEHTNDDDSIAIAFQAVLTKDESDRLRSLVPEKASEVRYWPVVRRGVSDSPRSMRLGRILWQPREDGTIGHDITLVDEAFDSSEAGNAILGLAGEPMVTNLVRHLSSLWVQFETLLAELEESGAVKPEALERVRASAEQLGPARSHAFTEV